MINIIIDTNIFRKNPKLDSAAFESIKNLGKSKRLLIHLPYIIEKEYLSQREVEYQKHIDSIVSSFENLNKKKLSPKLYKETKDYLEKIEDYSQNVKKFISDDFNKWIKEANVLRHDIDINKTRKVLEAYFEGTPPYSSKKSRSDIPDSFIYETMKELTKDIDNLHFISEDENLKKAAILLKKVTVYDSIESFIESDLCQILLKEETISLKSKLLISNLKQKHMQIKDYLKNNIEEHLNGASFINYDIPDDNHEAIIDGVYEPDEIEIDYDSVKYYGEGIFVIPFILNVEVMVYYYLFKQDYYRMDEFRANHISILDHNENYYEVEEDFYVKVEGNMKLRINIKKFQNESELEKSFDFDSLNIDQIEDINIIERT